MISVYDCWQDPAGNKWNKELYTEEDAEKASSSLVNCTRCYNCSDCKECVNCQDCHDCVGCSDCISCTSCKEMWKSKGCYECEGLMIALNLNSLKRELK